VKRTALVVPCFNEAVRFPANYWREIIGLENEISWIFVDDGSYDATFEILQEVTKGTSAQTHRFSKNNGKANAIRLGLLEAIKRHPEIEVLGYLDSDGAFSKADILRLAEISLKEVNHNSGAMIDAVISSRVALSGRAIHRNQVRHYIGRIVATVLTYNWSDAPYDTQSGFKLFRNSNSLQVALLKEFESKWFVDMELLLRIGIENRGNLSIWEEPLNSWRDVEGSKISWRDSITILREIWVVRRTLSTYLKSSR